MEENTDPNMETDVSSTTEDVLEGQEVTGSDGKIEMVIVVEKMDDESNEEQQMLVDENTSNVLMTTEKPQPDTQVIIKTPTKSPRKDTAILPSSPSKSDIEQIDAETEARLLGEDQPIEASTSQQADPAEAIDSSNKNPQSTNNEEQSPPIQKSPVKETHKFVLTSPKKDLLSQNSTMSTSIQKSPEKTTQIIVLKSPKKDLLSQDSIMSTSIQKSPEKTTPIIFLKSPKKDLLSQDSTMSTSIQKSPEKTTPIIVLKSPKKDLLSQDSTMSTSMQKSPEKTTQIIVLKSPKKDLLSQDSTMSKSVQKSPEKATQNFFSKSFKKDVLSQDSTKESLLIETDIKVNGTFQCNNTIKLFESSIKLDESSTKTDESSSKNVTTENFIDIIIDKEGWNDSQTEVMSDTSEKEHKSISRELKSLINSAKESKIISECNQLTSKTRKSRTGLDTSTSSLEPSKIQDARRSSNNSQKSNCSEKSDKTLKRSMRSQNPEFVSKVKQFLNSVTGKYHKDAEEEEDEEEKLKVEPLTRGTPPKVKKTEQATTDKSNKLRLDPYCWRCHWAVEQTTNEKVHTPMQCTVCPRSFHYKCLSGTERSKIDMEKTWVCPECLIVLHAEGSDTRSQAMKKLSLGNLSELLKHALERMMDLNGVEPFMQPVDRAAFPDYDKYVVHPMDLSVMKAHIAEGLYGSTEAFLADAQWILHNSIIFNTLQSKLTAGARALVRSCRAEMGEIEACPQCYAAAHARRPTWFTDVCTTPHILLWAKLKGFPYWPAKGMSVNSSGLVDVRFFGAHDRAWVPAKDCFLFSEKDPNNFRTKRQDIIDSMKEAEQHIRNISRKYGQFNYPPFKTQFDPSKLYEQLKMMIPFFDGEVGSVVKEKSSPAVAKGKSRSNSKSSKSSFNDGDMSENEETLTVSSRKMADGAEIAKMEDDDSINEKDIIIEVDSSSQSQANEETSSSCSTNSRKRRRSDLEEAIITIIETSSSKRRRSSEKRKRLEEVEEAKPEPESSSSQNGEDKPTEIPEDEPIEEIAAESDRTPSKVKHNEVTYIIEKEKNQRVTPIRITLVPNEKRHATRTSSSREPIAKIITPTKDNEKTTPQRQKSSRSDKVEKASSRNASLRNEKGEKTFSRSDKHEKTLNTKSEKTPNTKHEKVDKILTPKTEKVEKTPISKTDKAEKTLINKTDKAEKTAISKAEKVEKSSSDKTPKEDRSKSEKRRNSKSNRSINCSSTRRDKSTEKKPEKTAAANSNKDKHKENNSSNKDKEKQTEVDKTRIEKHMSPKPTECQSPKSVKDRLRFDDDTTLAVISREANESVITRNNACGLPTISCVRSLSTTAMNTSTATTNTTTNAHTIDITVDASSDSSIFIPTSTDSVKNMNDAASKLQQLRSDEPVVGRVGVRAFARMTSPEKQNNNDTQVEIKSEPIDLDDADRHMEKMDLMNAFRLRPVNPLNVPNAPSNLREVRINKVVVTPSNTRKAPTKPAEVRPRAKKTFPQPKKMDDGRSELNGKNSMVYIPIQPPITQAPMRMVRPTILGSATRLQPPPTSSANNQVNTVTTPLMQTSTSSPPSTSAAATTCSSVTSVASVATMPTVHTVPLMTSVNGQWMFSFQPVMSVGAIENASSPPIMNGLSERGTSTTPLVSVPTPVLGGASSGGVHSSVGGASTSAGPALTLVPAAPQPSGATSTRTPDNNAPGEPPRLQQRPPVLLNPLDDSTPIGSMPPPSTAGALTAKLNQNAVKLTDFFRTLLEDSLEKVDEPAAHVTNLRLQLEQARWRHQQEINEMKHNHDLTLAEMRASFEKEKLRMVSEARRSAQVELEAAVKQTKAKQWCANCSQEAQFYCCWNTSYCDYPCQRAHWTQHFAVCQQRSQDSNGEPPGSPENRLQPQPEMPKNSCAPSLTGGGKMALTRVYSQDPHSTPKTSIIVSMVEDTSGNQTMKCLGTYKPTTSSQLAPIILNKQLMNNEENANANKKVVTSSGGYLIVGSGNNASVVTPARRAHTIQYYT